MDIKSTIQGEINEEFIFPASYAQSRLWLMNSMIEDKSVYNISSSINIKGNLDISILEKSLNEIVNRHESLRTYFDMVDGELMQIIKSKQLLKLKIVDLQDFPTMEREKKCLDIIKTESTFQFNLNNTNLLRTILVQLSPRNFKLIITMHHIIADGWSLGLFIQELSILYNGFYKKVPPVLPKLEIQYADFSEWEREYLEAGKIDNKIDYWKEQLKGELPVLELPTDKPRPPVQSFKGALYEFSIPLELTKRLRELSNQQGVTLYMTLLSAFTTFLYRLTGQEDILIGSPVANRNQQETESLIGYFVNNLVMRTSLSDNPNFIQLLKHVQTVATNAYINQEVPFEKLIEHLGFKRSNSFSSLFQVMFAFQNTPQANLDLSNLSLEIFRNENGTSKYDLTLDITETQQELLSTFEYNVDLFNESTVKRWSVHFITLLESIVDNPYMNISELSILKAEERKQLLWKWNDTDKMYSKELCIHQLFEQQVKLTPDKTAINYENQSITYHELNQKANQVAHYLLKKGMRPQELVGICLDRSLDMIIGLLGILKAGGAYVPIETQYPSKRLQFIIDDANISFIITQEAYANKLSTSKYQTILLDKDCKNIYSENKSNLDMNYSVDNLVYVIYTSGSTGNPKGVCIEHQQLLNYIYDRIEKFNLKGDLKFSFATVSTLAADLGNTPIFLSLCTGGKLHIISNERLVDSQKLADYFKKHEIDCLKIVPSHLSMLLNTSDGAKILPKRWLIVGGEALHYELLDKIYTLNSTCDVINEYGPTEATIGTIDYVQNNNSRYPMTDTMPIGRPINNTQIFILDKNLQPVPIGVLGEIYIGGESVARGYLNQPELTNEKFIKIPELSRGSRLYRTGDLAKYHPTGIIEYWGRADDQVKIRGYRIEIGEIESVIMQHKNVKELAIVVNEDNLGNKQLVAYVSLITKDELFNSNIKKYLKNRLPDYMIPSTFILLDYIPLSPNGKVNRRELPKLSVEDSVSSDYVAPQTTLEKTMVDIWKNLFGIDKIGINDNFFEIGGHSLLAAKLVWYMRRELGMEFSLNTIFLYPTIAELIQYQLERVDEEKDQEMIIKIRKDQTKYPLTYAQKGIWLQDQLNLEKNAYNMSLPLKIIGKLNINALEESINKVIERHEVLKAKFINERGLPKQILANTYSFNLPIEYVQERSKEDIDEIVKTEMNSPINLSSGPLFRAKVLHVHSNEHILIITIHHIISDAVSVKILLDEIMGFYSNLVRKTKLELPNLSISYADYASWQQEWINSSSFQKKVSYWKNQLNGVPPFLELPTEFNRPSVQSFKGSFIEFSIPQEITNLLRKLANSQGATLYMIFMSVWNALLYKYTGQRDLVIGTSASGRNEDTESLIGLFINTLPIRTKLNEEDTFLDLLSNLKQTSIDAFSNQDIPFELLLNSLEIDRNPSRNPLCQVFLTYQVQPNLIEHSTDLIFYRMPIQITSVQYDLVVEIIDNLDSIEGRFEYSSALFSEHTIKEMIQDYLNLLKNVVEMPEENISKITSNINLNKIRN